MVSCARPSTFTAETVVRLVKEVLWDELQPAFRLGVRDLLEFNAADDPVFPLPGSVKTRFLRDPRRNQELTDWVLDAGFYRRWSRTKIIYEVEETLSRELSDTDTSALIPREVLERLPHPNPMFVFPVPVGMRMPAGEKALLRAVFIAGRTRRDVPCGTHSPQRAAYLIVAFSDVLDEGGNVTDVDVTKIALRMEQDVSIDEMTARIASAYHYLGRPAAAAPDGTREYIRDLAALAIAHLLYVCSDEPDVIRAPRRPAARGTRREERPAVVLRVGFHVGPAIRAARERYARESSPGTGTGRRVAPHLRRAHWHTVLYGPGKSQRKLRWLRPIPVNADLGDLRETVIPVTR